MVLNDEHVPDITKAMSTHSRIDDDISTYFPLLRCKFPVILCERSMEIPSLSQDMPTMWEPLDHGIVSGAGTGLSYEPCGQQESTSSSTMTNCQDSRHLAGGNSSVPWCKAQKLLCLEAIHGTLSSGPFTA